MWSGTNWQRHAVCFRNIHRQLENGKNKGAAGQMQETEGQNWPSGRDGGQENRGRPRDPWTLVPESRRWQLQQAYPLRHPFLETGHCVLGRGPGTLPVACDPTGMTSQRFRRGRGVAEDNSLNPETHPTQVKRFSCLNDVIFFSALITESCNWNSPLIQRDAKNSLF